MLALPDQPLATEVREHLKYTDEQWDRFNAITLKEVKKLLDPGTTWGDVEASVQAENLERVTWGNVKPSEQAKILERVNAELTKKNIPEVDPVILSKRMGRAISYTKFEIKHKKLSISASGTGDSITSSVTSPMASAAIQSPEPQGQRRYYDPIRDL